MAEIGGLGLPTQSATVDFLVEVLLKALREIPSSGAAWSWGEFHDGGLQPLYDISREKDWYSLAVATIDLGLADARPTIREGEILSPIGSLARNLTEATEGLLHEIRLRLEAAGVSPYGHRGLR